MLTKREVIVENWQLREDCYHWLRIYIEKLFYLGKTKNARGEGRVNYFFNPLFTNCLLITTVLFNYLSPAWSLNLT